MLAYVNGAITPEEEAKVSINDRGWLYGDAVFETLRTYKGCVFKLVEHLGRLQRSADLVGIDIPLTAAEIEKALDALLAREAAAREIMVRITVSRGDGGLGLYPAKPPKATVVIQLRELPDYPPETFTAGWSAIVAKTRRNSPDAINPEIKSTNFLNNVLAKKEAVEAGVNEALILNQQGFIAESSVSNFFMVKSGQLRTPPVSDGILPGITRQSVIGLAEEAGIPVWERSTDVAAAYAADEVFLTLTSAGLIPIVSIDGRPVADGRPGPITNQLRRLYSHHIDEFKRGCG